MTLASGVSGRGFKSRRARLIFYPGPFLPARTSATGPVLGLVRKAIRIPSELTTPRDHRTAVVLIRRFGAAAEIRIGSLMDSGNGDHLQKQRV